MNSKSPTKMAPKCFTVLPIELHDLIASELSPVDCFALRRTCQGMKVISDGSFTKQFFSHRRFWRNRSSLEILDQIAESRLGAFLRTVTIGIELIPHVTMCVASRPSRLRPAAGDKPSRLALLADQKSFLDSGLDIDMLASSLPKLPNLETVAVQGFPSRCREWVSPSTKLGYGLKTIISEQWPLTMTSRMFSYADIRTLASECVQVVLDAMTRAKRPWGLTSLKKLKISHGTFPGDYHTRSFEGLVLRLPQNPLLMQSLEELELEIEENGTLKQDGTWTLDPEGPRATTPVKRALSQAENLVRLRLGIKDITNRGEIYDLWDWLATSPLTLSRVHTRSSPKSPAFQHLQELQIGQTYTDRIFKPWTCIPIDSMLSLITKVSPTLVKLSLHGVMLVRSEAAMRLLPVQIQNSKTLQPYYAKPPAKISYWADLIAALSEHCERLDEVDFRHGYQIGCVKKSSRMKLGQGPLGPEHTLVHKGSDVREVLSRLVGELRSAAVSGLG